MDSDSDDERYYAILASLPPPEYSAISLSVFAGKQGIPEGEENYRVFHLLSNEQVPVSDLFTGEYDADQTLQEACKLEFMSAPCNRHFRLNIDGCVFAMSDVTIVVGRYDLRSPTVTGVSLMHMHRFPSHSLYQQAHMFLTAS